MDDVGVTDVTMTAPLALTQARMIWVGVTPRNLAAAFMGPSTGPPGNLVIGLHSVSQFSMRRTGKAQGIRKATISFDDNAMLRCVFKKRFVLDVVVRVELNLQ